MSTAVYILGGAVVAGVGVVLYQNWKRGQETGAPTKCDAFGSLIGSIAGSFAGPSDLSANANAKQAATMACNALNSKLGKQAIETARDFTRVPTSVLSGLGGIRNIGGRNCEDDDPSCQSVFNLYKQAAGGRGNVCPEGQSHVVDHRTGRSYCRASSSIVPNVRGDSPRAQVS